MLPPHRNDQAAFPFISIATRAVADETVMLPTGRGQEENACFYGLIAFSADSGKVRWRLPIEPAPGTGAPLVAVPGTVFIGGTTAMVHAVSEV